MKKTLGVTGTISSAVTRLLAESGYELWLLNLGNRAAEMPAGVPLKPCHAASDILSAVAPPGLRHGRQTPRRQSRQRRLRQLET